MDDLIAFAETRQADRVLHRCSGNTVERGVGWATPCAKTTSSPFRPRRAAQFSGSGIVSRELVSGARRGPRRNLANQPGSLGGDAGPSYMAGNARAILISRFTIRKNCLDAGDPLRASLPGRGHRMETTGGPLGCGVPQQSLAVQQRPAV